MPAAVSAPCLNDQAALSNVWHSFMQVFVALLAAVARVHVYHQQAVRYDHAVAALHPAQLIKTVQLVIVPNRRVLPRPHCRMFAGCGAFAVLAATRAVRLYWVERKNSIAGCCEITICWHLRSEEHTSELQSRGHLVCRRLLEKRAH